MCTPLRYVPRQNTWLNKVGTTSTCLPVSGPVQIVWLGLFVSHPVVSCVNFSSGPPLVRNTGVNTLQALKFTPVLRQLWERGCMMQPLSQKSGLFCLGSCSCAAVSVYCFFRWRIFQVSSLLQAFEECIHTSQTFEHDQVIQQTDERFPKVVVCCDRKAKSRKKLPSSF